MLLGREKKERRALRCILEGRILCQLSAQERRSQAERYQARQAGRYDHVFPGRSVHNPVSKETKAIAAFDCLLPGGDLAFLDRSYIIVERSYL
jgi:hypothetical protein